ncbi:hypothetical protein AB1N83_011695 [Pleurotus pulmonarius]
MKEYYDKETDILTEYYFPIKDIEIQVKFDDSGGNVGGRGNHIHVKPPPASRLPTEQSRAQGLLLAQARRRPQPQPQPRGAKPPTRGVARCVKARPQWRP